MDKLAGLKFRMGPVRTQRRDTQVHRVATRDCALLMTDSQRNKCHPLTRLAPRRSDWGRDPVLPLMSGSLPELRHCTRYRSCFLSGGSIPSFSSSTGVATTPTGVAALALRPPTIRLVLVVDGLSCPALVDRGQALPTGVGVLQAVCADVLVAAPALPAAIGVPLSAYPN